MLSPEVAEKRLKEFRRAEAGKAPKEAVERLPEHLQPMARALLGIGKEAHKPGASDRALKQLEALPSAERDPFFRTFLPGFEDVIERAWNLQKRLPYTNRWYQKPYRAPSSPATSLAARGVWLSQIYSVLHPYEQRDVRWLAAWAPYLETYSAVDLGVLLAAAIDAGDARGEEVLDILMASGTGAHEIGAMGRHVVTGLLTASRPEGWELVEKMLVAAQGQEGLRQVVLESVQSAHPEAFRRMVRLMRQQNMIRFSAALRAVAGWFDFEWDVSNAKEAAIYLDRLGAMLDDPAERDEALRQGDARECYLALWSIAFEDAIAAIGPAAKVLHDPDPERRFVGASLLASLGLHEAQQELTVALDDSDLRIAFCALYKIMHADEDEVGAPPDIFPSLERLLARCPKERQNLDLTVWPWVQVVVDRKAVAGTLSDHLGSRSPKVLIPYLSSMDPYARGEAVEALAKPRKNRDGDKPASADETESTDGPEKSQMKAVARRLSAMGLGQNVDPARLQDAMDQVLTVLGDHAEKKAAKKKKAEPPIEDPEIRETLLALVGDPAEGVRQEALKALKRCKLTNEEAVRMEALLTRKASDLRAALIKMLVNQSDEVAVESTRRLTSAKHELQRAAGLELAQILAKAGRRESECRELIEQHQSAEAGKRSAVPSAVLQTGPEPTLENGLGLYDPAQRTPVTPPRFVPGFKLLTPAAEKLLRSLDDWIENHKDVEYASANEWQVGEPTQLGSGYLALAQPNAALPAEEDAKRLQLLDLWEAWWNSLPADHKDADGGTLLRAYAHLFRESERFWERSLEGKQPPYRHSYVDTCIVQWMIKIHPPVNGADICLDALSTDFHAFSQRDGKNNGKNKWRERVENHGWMTVTRYVRDQVPRHWKPEHDARLFGLLHWMDQPSPRASRHFPELAELCAAYNAGGATAADLYDQLIGPRKNEEWNYPFTDIQAVSGRRGHPLFKTCPALEEAAERCRQRIVEIEAARGEMKTPVTKLALALRWSGGAETVLRLLTAMGKLSFHRGHGWGNEDRGYVLSQLIRASYPREEERPEAFAQAVRASKIPAARLLDLAMFAPQWARHTGAALDWPDLDECVWWLHAHTKDDRWQIDDDLREAWAAEVNLRTPLDAQSLVEGAVDVEWFQRIHTNTSVERWKALDASAKYASGGGGHKRAQLFADAMLDRIPAETLLQRMTDKRSGDAVRAYGLVPLADGEAREKDLLARYQALQEFLQTGREFGSMRQASEKLAVQIAMDNLSRTAGYPDPIRLQWAMERKAIGDLARGPVSVTAGDVTVRLLINALGEAVMDVSRDGKPLKSIPAAVKKLPEVKALDTRKREVAQQTRRMRKALEEAMVRGDAFRAGELAELIEHPVLARMLRSLVFVGSGDKGIAGYPAEEGLRLETHTGALLKLDASTELRIAHPVDLLATGEWHLWQKECFLHERVQPFKQVFRELYVLTEQERTDREKSLRYAGHQVNTRQAMALLGNRGWIARPEEGVQRVYHRERIVAQVEFNEYYTTPADVEGLTVESVDFHRRGEWESMPLDQVPPRLFSEVMRDVDLMVSVAHQGGIDLEASASTVEMRASLVMEASRLMKLDNVRCDGSHVKVEGKLASYSIHLGSGVVHRQPGGFLCIVPVHGQHRGRLFLPFVDDDPRTAEVVSKTLLLAKDTEIKDPIILEQILPRT